jgi:CheY-like chemotaxis protein/Tfp pilus assembly protein PilZ
MKKRILVANNNHAFLMYTGILLTRMGFKVIPAENGAEVLNLIKLCAPDIVMLDTHLTIIDGMSVLKSLKEDKQTSHIPVIMVLSNSANKTIKECTKMGCEAYLSKPINISKLHEVLQKSTFSQFGKHRKHLRMSFIRKVIVTFKKKRYELYAETLSEGGIYIRGLKPFPIGSEVEVTIPLKGRRAIRLKGAVIYTKGLFGDVLKIPPGMAIEFKGNTDKKSKILKNYVEDLIAEDILESQEEALIEK